MRADERTSKSLRERNLKGSLTNGEYAQLVKDLRAAQRAFERMEAVAPDLLWALIRATNRRRGAQVVAHEAFDDLIDELRQQRQCVSPQRVVFRVHRGRTNG